MRGLLRRLQAFGGVFILIISLVALLPVPGVQAAPEATFTGPNTASGIMGEQISLGCLQLVGDSELEVSVQLRVSEGLLNVSDYTEITVVHSDMGNLLNLSGTLADINEVLTTLVYEGDGLGVYTLEAATIGEGQVFFPGNGHLYEYVAHEDTEGTPTNINWVDAEVEAAERDFQGISGYLATITSEAENDFVAERLEDDGWMDGMVNGEATDPVGLAASVLGAPNTGMQSVRAFLFR